MSAVPKECCFGLKGLLKMSLIFSIILLVLSSNAFALDPQNTKPTIKGDLFPRSLTPFPKDIPYPGIIKIELDATDIHRRIFWVKEIIPIAEDIRKSGGKMTLLYSKYLPGKHSDAGEIDKIAGLIITTNDKKRIHWVRDPVDFFSYHIDVPKRTKELTLNFQYVSATKSEQGRVVVTNEMMNVQWPMVSFYPAGFFMRQIKVKAQAAFPKGWSAASGLPSKSINSTYYFDETDYETLVDSPIFAGLYFNKYPLSDRVNLNIFSDAPQYINPTKEQLDAHSRMVEQCVKLFGAQHYDKYEFLLALTSNLGGIGLEHHRSSENSVDLKYFQKWDKGIGRRGLLPHEMVHSWNGKFRRPEKMWVPTFNVPMENDLLWVYEGQTTFWGDIITVRSGLITKEQALDSLAYNAAIYDQREGRSWRHLQDTTVDPVTKRRRPQGWRSYSRSEDYYTEGSLVWMEADNIIRTGTGNQKGLDDFAKRFFGKTDGDWGVLTYNYEEVINDLTAIYQYDWNSFLQKRLHENAKGAPLDGVTKGGYKLEYVDTPTPYIKALESKKGNLTNLIFSLGINIKNDVISEVLWGSVGFKSQLIVGDKIVAVNGYSFSKERILEAIKNNSKEKNPIKLLIQSDDYYREVKIDYKYGLRYPKLVKVKEGEEGILDQLLKPL